MYALGLGQGDHHRPGDGSIGVFSFRFWGKGSLGVAWRLIFRVWVGGRNRGLTRGVWGLGASLSQNLPCVQAITFDVHKRTTLMCTSDCPPTETSPKQHRDKTRHPGWKLSWCTRRPRPPYPYSTPSLSLLGKKDLVKSQTALKGTKWEQEWPLQKQLSNLSLENRPCATTIENVYSIEMIKLMFPQWQEMTKVCSCFSATHPDELIWAMVDSANHASAAQALDDKQSRSPHKNYLARTFSVKTTKGL